MNVSECGEWAGHLAGAALGVAIVHPDPKHPVVPQLGGWALEDVERLCLEQTLVLCGGNKVAAARSLGVTEKTVYNKIARLGLR